MSTKRRRPLDCKCAIDVIERAYRLDGDDSAWLERIAASAAPELDRGLGAIAYVADGSSMAARVVASAHATPELVAALRKLNDEAPPAVVANLRAAPRGFYSVHDEYRGYRDLIAYWRNELGALGVADGIGVSAPAGRETVMLWAPCADVERVEPIVKATWTRVGVHLSAGFRLRRTLRGEDLERLAEAIVDVDGDVKHAVGAAASRAAKAALGDAVRNVERARGPLRQTDPIAASGLWTGLVQARWSLVDYRDHDGTRLYAAHPNAPGVLDPRRISDREASAVALTIDGASFNEIAYALGITAANARARLTSGLRKIGLESRSELVRLAARRGEMLEESLENARVYALVAPRKKVGLDVTQLLSPAEQAVAALAASGLSNAEIATARKSSGRTVANQMAAILRKLGMRSRHEIAAHLPDRPSHEPPADRAQASREVPSERAIRAAHGRA